VDGSALLGFRYFGDWVEGVSFGGRIFELWNGVEFWEIFLSWFFVYLLW